MDQSFYLPKSKSKVLDYAMPFSSHNILLLAQSHFTRLNLHNLFYSSSKTCCAMHSWGQWGCSNPCPYTDKGKKKPPNTTEITKTIESLSAYKGSQWKFHTETKNAMQSSPRDLT